MFKKYFVSLCLTISVAISAEVPLEKIINVDVALGEHAVFDFPFKIKSANPTSFKGDYNIQQISEDAQKVSGGTDYLDEKLPPKRAAKGSPQAKAKNDPINVKRGSHTISMYPKKYGEISFLVWGHDYPVMLKVKVTKDKAGPTHMKFVDYDEKLEEAKVLEKTSHEKMITVLISHLYKKKTPKGYQAKNRSKYYSIGNIKMKLVRSIVGDSYRGDEWIIKNNYKVAKKFHEEIFYNDGIYAVSLENNVLQPKESTRLFVVRRNDTSK